MLHCAVTNLYFSAISKSCKHSRYATLFAILCLSFFINHETFFVTSAKPAHENASVTYSSTWTKILPISDTKNERDIKIFNFTNRFNFDKGIKDQHETVSIDVVKSDGQLGIFCQGHLFLPHRIKFNQNDKEKYENKSGVETVSFTKGIHKIHCCFDAKLNASSYLKEDACCPDCCPPFHEWLEENKHPCFKPKFSKCASLWLKVYNSSVNAFDDLDTEYFLESGSFMEKKRIDAYIGHQLNLPCRWLQKKMNQSNVNLWYLNTKNSEDLFRFSSKPTFDVSENGICIKNFSHFHENKTYKSFIACSKNSSSIKEFFSLRLFEEYFVEEWNLTLNVNGISIETNDEVQLRLIHPISLNISCSFRYTIEYLTHTVICLNITVIHGDVSQRIWCSIVEDGSGLEPFTRNFLLNISTGRHATVLCSAWTSYKKPKLLKWNIQFFDLNQTILNINHVELVKKSSQMIHKIFLNSSLKSINSILDDAELKINFYVPYDTTLDVIISYNSTPNNVPLNLFELKKSSLNSRVSRLKNEYRKSLITFEMNTFKWYNSASEYPFALNLNLANINLTLFLNFHCYCIKMVWNNKSMPDSNLTLININSIVKKTISRDFEGCGVFEFNIVLILSEYYDEKDPSSSRLRNHTIEKMTVSLTKLPTRIDIVSISKIMLVWNNCTNLTYGRLYFSWISKITPGKQENLLIQHFQLTDLPFEDIGKVQLFYDSANNMNWLSLREKKSLFLENDIKILCACVNCEELNNSSLKITINNKKINFFHTSRSVFSSRLWTNINKAFIDNYIESSGKSNKLNITCAGSSFEIDIFWNIIQTPSCINHHGSNILECQSTARTQPQLQLALAKMTANNMKSRLIQVANNNDCNQDSNKINRCKVKYNITNLSNKMNGEHICLLYNTTDLLNQYLSGTKVPSDRQICKFVVPPNPTNILQLILVVMSAISLVLLFVIFFPIIYKKWFVRHQRHLRLKNNWLYLSEYLAVEGVDFDTDDTFRMRFDETRWGLSPSQIKVGSQLLGSGAFGEVRVGQYTPCAGGQPLLVAVKQPRDEFSDEHQRCLAEELKILGYIGQHEYIVSLIGAVIDRRIFKLQVVVEYCGHGNLQNFLKGKQLVARKSHPSVYQSLPNRLTYGMSSSFNNGSNFFQCDQEQAQLLKWTSGSSKISFATLRNSEFSNSAHRASLRSINDNVIAKSELYNFALHVANGMNYLAGRRVIHRDLAARNVLLADSPDKKGQLIAKICDFGLAKNRFDYTTIGDNEVGADYISTAMGCCNMPWRWLAPECFREMHYSTASDVWSYGVLLWEIFSLGRVPWEQYINNPGVYKSMLANIEAGDRLQQPLYASRSVYDLMLECWDMDPTRRPKFIRLEERILALIESLDFCGSLANGLTDSSGGSISCSNGRTISTSTTSSYIPEHSGYVSMTSPLKEEDENGMDADHTNKNVPLVMEDLKRSDSKSSINWGSKILDPMETDV